MSNKYQEALDRFKVVAQNDWVNNYQKCKDEEKTIHIGNYRMFEIDGEAIKTLQELVDKETLCSLSYEGDGYDPTDGELVYDTAICKCGRHFEIEYEEHYKYCPNCGQKLDWSEE